MWPEHHYDKTMDSFLPSKSEQTFITDDPGGVQTHENRVFSGQLVTETVCPVKCYFEVFTFNMNKMGEYNRSNH